MAGYFIYMLQTAIMLSTNPNPLPYLKSLSTCLNKATQDGYTEEFYLQQQELCSKKSNKAFSLREVEVLNCFHFEGKGQVNEEAYLLMLQTADGTKGTLVYTGPVQPDSAYSFLQNNIRH